MHTFEGSSQEQGEKSQMKNSFLDADVIRENMFQMK